MLRAAISNANEALAREPDLPIALRALAYVQNSTGRPVEALALARRIAEAGTDDLDTLAALAESYFRVGLAERAIPLYERALALEPDNREFRDQLSRIRFFLGEDRKGLEAIASVPPAQIGTFGMLLYVQNGELERAANAVRAARRTQPVSAAFGFSAFISGAVLAAAGDLPGATEVWSESVRVGEALLEQNENPFNRYGLALAHAKLGHAEQARRHMRQMLARDPKHPLFLFLASEIHALLGERVKATALLRAAIESGFYNLPMIDGMTRSPICTLYSLRSDPEFLAVRGELARRIDDLRRVY